MLKYVVIYQDSGIPIYSKCYSGFCGLIAKRDALLSGFLSALENFTKEMIGNTEDNECLQAVEMEDSIMRFYRTFPNNYSVVLGLKKENQEIAKDIFKAIETILETKYVDKDWTRVIPEFDSEFERTLHTQVLIPSLHDHGGFEDLCPHGEKCPLKTQTTNRKPIWQTLKNRFQMIREKMKSM